MIKISRNFSVYFFITILIASIYAVADDAPNIKKEKYLNKIYKTYNDDSTDAELWELLNSQINVLTYTTKKSDTLWNICEVLFGDGHYWPKVWALNRDILDPHNVPAGTVLRIIHGSIEEAPVVELGVFPGNLPKVKMPPEASSDILAQTINAEIPAAKKEIAPPLFEVPTSVPSWEYKRPETALITMDMGRGLGKFDIPEQALGYYVSETKVEGIGEIVGSELGMDSAADYQYIFVHFNAEPSEKTFTVVKDIGNLEDSFGGKTATMIQVQGLIEVQELVNKRKGIYRAQVKKTINPIEKGSKLVSSSLPSFSVKDSGVMGSASARIFGGQFGTSRRMFGPEAIVFLNQGRLSGLVEGQVLPVFQYQEARVEDSFVLENPKKIGKLKVIKISDKFSTAVVLEATEELRIGDGTTAESVKN